MRAAVLAEARVLAGRRLSQLLNNRATDVDDLIMNTLGALAGFALFKAGAACATARRRPAAPPSRACRCCPASPEPALYLAVACAGRFLLFNDFGVSGATVRR